MFYFYASSDACINGQILLSTVVTEISVAKLQKKSREI